jgi:hypothetical protein
MKLKYKKLVAREFLFFLAAALIFFGHFLAIEIWVQSGSGLHTRTSSDFYDYLNIPYFGKYPNGDDDFLGLLFLIFYVLRYTYYGTRWSIRQMFFSDQNIEQGKDGNAVSIKPKADIDIEAPVKPQTGFLRKSIRFLIVMSGYIILVWLQMAIAISLNQFFLSQPYGVITTLGIISFWTSFRLMRKANERLKTWL